MQKIILKKPKLQHPTPSHPSPRVPNESAPCEKYSRVQIKHHLPAPPPRMHPKDTAPYQPISRHSRSHMWNAQPPVDLDIPVLNADTGESLEYRQLRHYPKYQKMGRILLQWTRTAMPRHWDRRQRPQETTGSGNWNVSGHSKWILTFRQKKWSNLHKIIVLGTHPERKPQQDSNHHCWQQNNLPRWCSYPHILPQT